MDANANGSIRLRLPVEVEAAGDDFIATVPETGQILLLNASARFVVDELREGRDRAQLQRSFAEKFGLDADRAALDVDQALHDLTAEGLLDHDER